jgi:hypothetical protein
MLKSTFWKQNFYPIGLGNKNPRQRFTLSVHSFKNYGLLNGEHSPKFTQHVSLEYQRWLAERFILAWTFVTSNIKLCLATYVHVYYSFLILQLLIRMLCIFTNYKIIENIDFAHGEHKKKIIRMYSILFYIQIDQFHVH